MFCLKLERTEVNLEPSQSPNICNHLFGMYKI